MLDLSVRFANRMAGLLDVPRPESALISEGVVQTILALKARPTSKKFPSQSWCNKCLNTEFLIPLKQGLRGLLLQNRDFTSDAVS